MYKKSQYWTVLAGLLILSLLLTACGGTAKQEDTIKIGAALCLTGIQGPLDAPALKGAQVAVDEINKKGGVLGKKLELINLDGKSDPVTVGNVTVQLIAEGAKAIIAPSDFDFGGPASREAQKVGMVAISPAASTLTSGSLPANRHGVRRSSLGHSWLRASPSSQSCMTGGNGPSTMGKSFGSDSEQYLYHPNAGGSIGATGHAPADSQRCRND